MSSAERRNISKSDVELDRNNVLGRGRSSVVFGGTFGNTKVAIKRIMSTDVHPQWLDGSDDAVFNKITVLDHENILKLSGIYSDEHFRYHVFELCVASLFDYVCNTYKGEIPSPADGLYQMASGLNFIHSSGYVHRSIKPENVLISQSIQLKISDFGLTMPISTRASFSMSSGAKTSPNMQAREILQPMDDEDEPTEMEAEAKHTIASDTFSLGCLFFNFITKGGHPFLLAGGSRHFIVLNIIEGKYNLTALGDGHFAAPIIEKMIDSTPDQRLKLGEVIKSLEPHISRV